MNTTVSARMDADLKRQAEAVFAQLGITHSVAINALYSQVVLRQGLPFEVALSEKKSQLTFQDIRSAVRSLAERYGMDRVYLFGSQARGDAGPKSDVDLRIEPGEARGFAIGGFQYDVQEALGLPVDVATTHSLSEDFLAAIEPEEVLLYERKGA